MLLLSRVVLPNGFRAFDPNTDLLVYEIRVKTTLPVEHWWDQHQTLSTALVSIRTHQRERADAPWHRSTNKKGLVPSEGPSDGYCVVPAETTPALPAATNALLPVFATRVYGPHQAGPQELAMRWRNQNEPNGLVVAFDVKWDRDPKSATTHGFVVTREWDYFWDIVLNGIQQRALRNFYEVFETGLLMRLALDVDLAWADCKHTVPEVVDMVLECVERAFVESYPEQQAPLRRSDITVLDSTQPGVKVSLHVVGSSSRFLWADLRALAAFVKRVRHHAFPRLLGRDVKPNDPRTLLVDLSIYDLNSKFRLCENTKHGRESYLLPCAGLGLFRPTHFEQTVVCVQPSAVPAGAVVLGEGLRVEACDESRRVEACDESRLELYPDLCAFLRPLQVPTGSRHNVRWTRLGSELFMVPPERTVELFTLMANPRPRPPLLHEAPASSGVAGQRQKLALDLDGLPAHVPLELVIATVAQQLPLDECHVTEALPRKAPAVRSLHLVFQCSVPARGSHAAVVKRIAAACPREWVIDSPLSLRCHASDKLDRATGAFQGRPLCYVGSWIRGQWVTLPDDAHLHCKLSLLAGVDALPHLALREGEQETAAAATLVQRREDLALFENELRPVFGNDVQITRARYLGRVLAANVNSKDCPNKGAAHHSNGQRALFFETYWERRCWDPDCSHWRQRYAYQSPRPPAALAELESEPPAEAADELCALVLDVFPEDRPLWWGNGGAWQNGSFFGPTHTQGIRYRRGLLSLLRCSTTAGAQVRPLPAAASSAVTFDEQAARRLLELCPDGLLDLPSHCMLFYGAASGCLERVVRFHSNPPTMTDFVQQVYHATVSVDMARAFDEFYRSLCLLPRDMESKAFAVQAEWLALFAELGVAETSTFTLDRSPARELIQLGAPTNDMVLLVAPPGSGKTTALVQSGFKGDVVTSARKLSRNLAARFHMPLYMDDDDSVRPAHELNAEPRLCYVINSIAKLVGRPTINQLFVDEVTAVLHSLVSDTMQAKGPQALALLQAKLNGSIAASADITPALEGRLFIQHFGQNVHVVYKVHGPDASAMRCRELRSDRQLWDVYVRVLLYNAATQQHARWCRLYFPCSTVAAVEKARHLCARFWPAGVDRCAFVHAQSPKLPGFVDDPNATWTRFAIVCVSTTLKVGVSFEQPNYFHLILAFGCTGCGPSHDFVQLLQRVRPCASLLLFRIRIMGAPQSESDADLARTEQLLDEFASTNNINRSFFKPPASRKSGNAAYDFVAAHLADANLADHTNFVSNVRRALCERQMRVELSGVPPHEPLAFGRFSLAPLDPELDLSGPDLKEQLVQRILAAPDLTETQVRALYDLSRATTPEEQAAIERYRICHKLYRPHGPYSLEELTRLHVKDKYAEKVRRCSLVLLSEREAAAVQDERQHRFASHHEKRQHVLQEQHAVRAMLATLPGLDVERHLCGGEPFAITQAQLDQSADTVYRAQEQLIRANPRWLPKLSRSAKGKSARIRAHINATLVSLGLSRLQRHKARNRANNAWRITPSPATLFYATPDVANDDEQVTVFAERPPAFEADFAVTVRYVLQTHKVKPCTVEPFGAHLIRITVPSQKLRVVKVVASNLPCTLTDLSHQVMLHLDRSLNAANQRAAMDEAAHFDAGTAQQIVAIISSSKYGDRFLDFQFNARTASEAMVEATLQLFEEN